MDPMTMSSAIIGFSGVAITAICKWRPRGTNGYMSKSLCDERSTHIAASIVRIEQTQVAIFAEIKELRK